MKKIKPFIQLFLIAGLLFAVATACDKTDDPGGEDPNGDSPSAGTVKDADGNKYNTVKIGTQVWTVENLKTTRYNDGSAIPNVTDDVEWSNLTTGAYCNYENMESNVATYGRLYNWYAVNTEKLCPSGWYVPENNEWSILEDYLIDNGYNYDGTKDDNKIAKSLCSTIGWIISDIAGTPGASPENNNKTSFTALPCGFRSSDIFHPAKYFGGWWVSTNYSIGAWSSFLSYNFVGMSYYAGSKEYGFSVRCVKD